MSPQLRLTIVVVLSGLILLSVHSRVDWAGWVWNHGKTACSQEG